MSGTEPVAELARRAKAQTLSLRLATEEQRQKALRAIAEGLRRSRAEILEANRADLVAAREQGLSSALTDRLTLTEARLEALARSVLEIAEAPPVVGLVESSWTRPDGLVVQRRRIPLGVIGFIFESRPNVIVDAAALAIKSGNAILLKGGKEAERSNEALGQLVRQAVAPHLPADAVQIVPSRDRGAVREMIVLSGLIDLIIPRGGEALIRMVQEHALIPVIAHAKGLCHLYLHRDAPEDQAVKIAVNAKVQRPGVCNAVETLLVHQELAGSCLARLLDELEAKGVSLRADERLRALFPRLAPATADDWDTEYLDKILSVRLVEDEHEAIAHILRHTSHHTEAIVAQDPAVIRCFEEHIDASCIAINASTRFNDGGELGLGAEIGISTSKLHAYGPMGARELTTTRFVVTGQGHCRA